MTIQEQYAEALYQLVSENPQKTNVYIENLQNTLEKKHYSALLPQILRDCTALYEKHERSKTKKLVTQEQERTRVLVELYRTLLRTH